MPKYDEQAYKDALEVLGSNEQDPSLLDFARRVKADYEAPAAAPAHPDAERIKNMLAPELSPVPQVLSMQPGTTDPRGDEAAAQDWLVSGGPTAKGTVFVYEPPLDAVKKRLAEDSAFARELTGGVPVYPNEIAALDHGSDLYQSASDRMWRDTADAAVKGGWTAYRYAKAPWLQNGGAMPAIQSLGMKAAGSAMPALDTLNTFVMGVDKTANFGALRAAQEAGAFGQGPVPEGAEPLRPGEEAEFYMHPTLGKVPKSMQPKFKFAHTVDEAAGGDVAKANAILEEEHPVASIAGQVAGAAPGVVGAAGSAVGMLGRAAKAGPFARAAEEGIRGLQPWSASNAGFDAIASLGQRGLGKLGVTEGVAPVLVGTAAGLLGGAATSVGQDAVTAAANAYQTGSPNMTLRDVGERALETGKTTALFGGGGAVLQQVGRAGAQAIRNSERLEGIPGRIERSTEFGVLAGPKLSPETKALIQQAQDIGIKNPGQLIAKEIAPAIKEAADQEVKAAIRQVTANKQKYFATPEAQRRIPVQNFIERAVKLLRESHQPDDGSLIPVGSRLEKVKNLMNEHIEGVSLQKRPGSVAVSPEEAEEFLAQSYRQKLSPAKKTGGGARELDPADLEAGAEKGSLAADLRRRGVTEVYLHPARYDAQRTEHLLQRELKGSRIENKSYRELNELDEALRMDRDVRPLDGKAGGWSALQSQHEELLRGEKALEQLVAPGGESFNALVRHGKPSDSDLLSVEAMRRAAATAGPDVAKKLDELRTMDELLRLRQMTNRGRYYGPGMQREGSVRDALTIRAFPILRALEPGLAPVGGGMGGRLGLVGQDSDEQNIQKALTK